MPLDVGKHQEAFHVLEIREAGDLPSPIMLRPISGFIGWMHCAMQSLYMVKKLGR